MSSFKPPKDENKPKNSKAPKEIFPPISEQSSPPKTIHDTIAELFAPLKTHSTDEAEKFDCMAVLQLFKSYANEMPSDPQTLLELTKFLERKNFDKRGKIDIKEFLKILESVEVPNAVPNEEDAIELFSFFDRRGKYGISVDDVLEVFPNMESDRENLEKAFHTINAEGTITIADFYEIMKIDPSSIDLFDMKY